MLFGGAGGALDDLGGVGVDRGGEVLGEPGLGGAGLADQEQRAVGDEGGDRDLDEALVADVFRRDLHVADGAAGDVGEDGAGGHLPAGGLVVLVGGGEGVDLAGEEDLGGGAEDVAAVGGFAIAVVGRGNGFVHGRVFFLRRRHAITPFCFSGP